MTKQIQKFSLVLIFLITSLISCIDLKKVEDFSSTSSNSLKEFEDINYNFKQNCLENCQDRKINDLNLSPNDCDCELNETADSITLLIYNSVRIYFDGLTNLANNDLTNYKFDVLKKALSEGDFGPIKIEKDHVEAYSKISEILMKSFTDIYRKKKIKEYVLEANEPIKVLINFLKFNLSKNLVGKLNVQKQRIKIYYFDLTKDATLSTMEKRKAVEDYYTRLSKIESQENELFTYSKILNLIAEGHQKLTQNIEKISKDEINAMISQYTNDIQDIISEFNKINR